LSQKIRNQSRNREPDPDPEKAVIVPKKGNLLKLHAFPLKASWRLLLELDPESGPTKIDLGIGAYLLSEF
jgi:hypothetical protein